MATDARTTVWRRQLTIAPADAGVLLAAAAASLAVLWAMHDALIDDVYITLGYARTLVEHGEWGLLPGIPANSATSPLNVLVLAGFTFVVRDPLAALWLVTVANALLLAAGLLRLGAAWGVGRRLAYVAVPLLLLNPLLASSLGMETMLAVTLLVWLLERAQAGAVAWFGWLAGATVLLRADLVVVIAVVWLLHPALRRPHRRPTTLALTWRAGLACLPWFVFSWIHFGSAIPDTLALKQHQGWGSFANGLWERYHRIYPGAVEATVAVAGLGLLVCAALPLLARREKRPPRARIALPPLIGVAAAPLAGAAYFALYWLLDVPPYFWYYGVPLAALVLAASWGIALLSQSGLRIGRARSLSGPAVTAVAAFAALLPSTYVWGSMLADHAPLREAPVHGNWALTPEYKEIGLDLAARFSDDVTLRSSGEFGTILYYCECTLLDRFSARSLILPWLHQQRRSTLLMRLNYLWFDAGDYPEIAQDFHLEYVAERVDETLHPEMWNVYSPTRGHGHYFVVGGPYPPDLKAGVTPR